MLYGKTERDGWKGVLRVQGEMREGVPIISVSLRGWQAEPLSQSLCFQALIRQISLEFSKSHASAWDCLGPGVPLRDLRPGSPFSFLRHSLTSYLGMRSIMCFKELWDSCVWGHPGVVWPGPCSRRTAWEVDHFYWLAQYFFLGVMRDCSTRIVRSADLMWL